MKTLEKIVDSKAFYLFIAILWTYNAIVNAYNTSYLDVPALCYWIMYASPAFIAYGILNTIWKITKCPTV